MHSFRLEWRRLERSTRGALFFAVAASANGGCEDLLGLHKTHWAPAPSAESVPMGGEGPGGQAGGSEAGTETSGEAGAPASHGGASASHGGTSARSGASSSGGSRHSATGSGGSGNVVSLDPSDSQLPPENGGAAPLPSSGGAGTSPVESASAGESGSTGAGGVSGSTAAGSGGVGNTSGAPSAGTAGTSNAGAGAGAAGTSSAGAGGAPGIPPGALVDTSGDCLRASEQPGAALALARCADDPAEHWSMLEGDCFSPEAGSCLDGPSDESAGFGLSAPVTPAPPAQQWVFDGVYLLHESGLCLDTPNGDYEDHTLLELWQCHLGTPQSFTINGLGQIRHGSFCLDLPYGDTSDGNPLQLFTCDDDGLPDNQRFALTGGRLEPRNSGKCIGIAGGVATNGAGLEVQPCAPFTGRDPLQSFRVRGPVQNQGQCLSIANVAAPLQSLLDLEPCTGAVNQLWDWYF